MRTLTDHIVSADLPQSQLTISVLDEPGQGGANHEYRIAARYQKGEKLPRRGRIDDQTVAIAPDGSSEITLERILFQNGPIKEFGLNGITQEVLLTIVIDRLRSFQAGPFASDYNKQALFHAEVCLQWLQKRTRERLERGVEGTNQK
jgi:hypothetical protein